MQHLKPTIRRATKDDIPGLMALLYQVDAVHQAIRPDLFKGNTTKYNEQQLAVIIDNDCTPIFVCDEGKVVGHAICLISEIKDHCLLQDIKTFYIDDICVDETVRGHHIGQALYEHVRDFARSIGCYNITLNVWEGNDAAIRFYQRMGLRVQKTGMEFIL